MRRRRKRRGPLRYKEVTLEVLHGSSDDEVGEARPRLRLLALQADLAGVRQGRSERLSALRAVAILVATPHRQAVVHLSK